MKYMAETDPCPAFGRDREAWDGRDSVDSVDCVDSFGKSGKSRQSEKSGESANADCVDCVDSFGKNRKASKKICWWRFSTDLGSPFSIPSPVGGRFSTVGSRQPIITPVSSPFFPCRPFRFAERMALSKQPVWLDGLNRKGKR